MSTDADPLPLPGLDDEPPVEGRPRVTCRLCGRPLTDRHGRLYGLGPDCRRKLHVRTVPRPPEHDVKQDALPGM